MYNLQDSQENVSFYREKKINFMVYLPPQLPESLFFYKIY